MNVGKISVRYAKALVLSAKEKNILEPVRKDMQLFLSMLKEVPELTKLLESPVINSRKKIEILNALFTNQVNSLTLSFFRLAVLNKREEYLPGMARMYIDLFKQEEGIKMASLITAVPLGKEIRDAMINIIKNLFHAEIELNEKVEKQIIGGFILQVEDQLLDASITGQLMKIRNNLIDKSFKKR